MFSGRRARRPGEQALPVCALAETLDAAPACWECLLVGRVRFAPLPASTPSGLALLRTDREPLGAPRRGPVRRSFRKRWGGARSPRACLPAAAEGGWRQRVVLPVSGQAVTAADVPAGLPETVFTIRMMRGADASGTVLRSRCSARTRENERSVRLLAAAGGGYGTESEPRALAGPGLPLCSCTVLRDRYLPRLTLGCFAGINEETSRKHRRPPPSRASVQIFLTPKPGHGGRGAGGPAALAASQALDHPCWGFRANCKGTRQTRTLSATQPASGSPSPYSRSSEAGGEGRALSPST